MDSIDIKMCPVRNIYMLESFENTRDIYHLDNVIRGKKIAIAGESLQEKEKYLFDFPTVQTIKKTFQSNIKSTYHFFIHGKMDGYMSACQLKDIIGKKGLFLDHQGIGNYWADYIKPKELLRIGLQKKETTRKSLLSTAKKWTIVKGFGSSIITIGTFILALLTAARDQKHLIEIPKTESLLPFLALLCGAFCACTAYFIHCGFKEREKAMIKEIKEKIKNYEGPKFDEFIRCFKAADFEIPGLKYCMDGIDIICPLSRFYPREQKILDQYWQTNNIKENWWIFIEENTEEIIPISEKYERDVYRILPLSYAEKLKLASAYNNRLIHNPGLKIFGIDYVVPHPIYAVSLIENETKTQFIERVNRFIDRNKDQLFDIPRVIRMVAELAYTFHVDFSSDHKWESIFSYSGEDSLVRLDRQLSQKLIRSNTSTANATTLNLLKSVISEIIEEFKTTLYRIVQEDYGPSIMIDDIQLYLVKALRYHGGKKVDRCHAIISAVYDHFNMNNDNHNIINLDEWCIIIQEALHKCHEYRFGDYNACLIHILLDIQDQLRTSEVLYKLLCTEIVQIASKETIFFYNNQQHNDIEGIDVIKDHYRLLRITAPKVLNMKKLSIEQVPWMGLINTVNADRVLYANLLNNGENEDIIKYYQILYSLFASKAYQSGAVLCKPLLSSFNQYIENIGFIIFRLIAFVEELGKGRNCQVEEGCALLRTVLNCYNKKIKIEEEEIDEERAEESIMRIDDELDELYSKLFIFLAVWDAMRFSIGCFAASIVYQYTHGYSLREEDSELTGDTKDLYVGNPIARLVYLTYEPWQLGLVSKDGCELIDTLTQYNDPDNVIFSYLLVFAQHHLPIEYERKAESVVASQLGYSKLIPTEGLVNADELDVYIAQVNSCGAINKEIRIKILGALLSNYEEYYGERDDSTIIQEYLYRYIYNKPSEKYREKTSAQLIKDASAVVSSDDIMYLLYSLVVQDNEQKSKDEYDDDIPQLSIHIAQSLLDTKFLFGTCILIVQWIKSMEYGIARTVDYWEVAKKIYEKIDTYIVSYSHLAILLPDNLIDPFISFFRALENNDRSWRDEYPSYFPYEKTANNFQFLSEQREKHLQMELYVAARTKCWKNFYPLLMCIGYLINRAIVLIVPDKKYARLGGQEQKESWLSEHVMEISPIGIFENVEGISESFRDVLNLALRKKNQQLANRLMIVIQNHVSDIIKIVFSNKDADQRVQILEIIQLICDPYAGSAKE